MTLRARFHCLLAVAALLLGGCKSEPPHEAVLKDGLAKMKELLTVLRSVKDEASAKAAKPKVDAIAADLQELKTKAEKIGKVDSEEEKQLGEKYGEEMKKLMPQVAAELTRIARDPKLAAVMKDAKLPGT